MASGETKKLAEFATSLTFEDIPRHTVSQAKFCILDALGCGLFGSTMSWSRIVSDLLETWGGIEEATLWGRRLKRPAPAAALANGVAVNGFEMDDTHIEGGGAHPGGVVVPAVFATAEAIGGVSGKEALAAIVIGYEVLIRIATAVGSAHAVRGFYTPSTAGTFGAATAAGRLLGLDVERMTYAMHLAANRSAGLYSPSMVKRLNMGTASQNGIVSAFLSRGGITGIPDALEAKYGGFLATFADPQAAEGLASSLAAGFAIDDVGFKAYSCSRSNHSTLDAIRQLRTQSPDLEPELVEEVLVRCTTPTKVYGAGYEVKDVPAAIMSLPYCASVMLIYGDAFVDQFTEANVADPSVQQMMRRVDVQVDPALDAMGPQYRWIVDVEITLKDGRRLQSRVSHPRGTSENPMTSEEIVNKFEALARRVLTPERVGHIVSVTENLEDQGDLRTVAKMLIPEEEAR